MLFKAKICRILQKSFRFLNSITIGIKISKENHPLELFDSIQVKTAPEVQTLESVRATLNRARILSRRSKFQFR